MMLKAASNEKALEPVLGRALPALGFLLLMLAGVLLACGSGGGESPTAPGALDAAAVEERSFGLINRARAQEGLEALSFDEDLSRLARDHSRAMRDQGFFGHEAPNGAGLRSRLRASGIVFSAAGENLALVSHESDPAGIAHAQLLASPEHRDVMLDSRFVQVGVGVVRAGDAFWITQVFLKP